MALLRHDNRMLDFILGCCFSEWATNSKEAFFIDEWVQLGKVAVEFVNAVSLPCTLAILELVVVTFKFFEGLDILLEVVKLNGFQNYILGLGKLFYSIWFFFGAPVIHLVMS